MPLVELLLKEGKSPLNAQDVEGLTPLHHACAEGHGDTADALLKAGAETDKKDSDGRLALQTTPDSSVRFFTLKFSHSLRLPPLAPRSKRNTNKIII